MKLQLVLKTGVACLGYVLLCSSCTLLSPPAPPAPDLSSEFLNLSGQEALANEWWTAFGDPCLDDLVAQALGSNLSIEQAAARFRQAQAVAVKSGAGRFPSVTGSAEAASIRRFASGRNPVTTEEFTLSLAAGYEIDLWGRVASGRRAALRAVDAGRYDLQSAAMSVAGETARTYFEWQYLQARRAILYQQLELRRKQLLLMERRFQTGESGAQDVLQQRERVAAAEGALPPVESALRGSQYRLAVLTGRPPSAGPLPEVRPLPGLPEGPAAGVPAELLARRPDLRAAWARLASAGWAVRAAQADRLPAIRLTGAAAWRDDSVNTLFDNWALNLAAGLTAPLIDGGARRAEAARAAALEEERLAAYCEAVYNALAEVETALATEAARREHWKAVRRQLVAATALAEESFRRYTRGAQGYFEAVNAESSRQTLELSELQARFDLLSARIQLYRALGGDWEQVLQTYR